MARMGRNEVRMYEDAVGWFTQKTAEHYNSVENGGPPLLDNPDMYHVAVCGLLTALRGSGDGKSEQEWDSEKAALLAFGA